MFALNREPQSGGMNDVPHNKKKTKKRPSSSSILVSIDWRVRESGRRRMEENKRNSEEASGSVCLAVFSADVCVCVCILFYCGCCG